MPSLTARRFSERNQLQVGMVALLGLLVAVAAALNVGRVADLFGGPVQQAMFVNGGGIRPGDDVRVSGMVVGAVDEVRIVGRQVRVSFRVSGVELGDRTRIDIRSANALGRRYLDVDPAGSGNGDIIPVSRTSPGYGVIDALSDFTATATALDTGQLSESLDALSDAFSRTPDELPTALEGVQRVSEVVNSRDAALSSLLANTADVSAVLAKRSKEIRSIMTDGGSLFAELQRRRESIEGLLRHARELTAQLHALAKENSMAIGPALAKLDRAVGILRQNKKNIDFVLKNASGFARALAETVGGGPFFYSYLQNVVPSNFAPLPEVDLGGGGPP